MSKTLQDSHEKKPVIKKERLYICQIGSPCNRSNTFGAFRHDILNKISRQFYFIIGHGEMNNIVNVTRVTATIKKKTDSYIYTDFVL